MAFMYSRGGLANRPRWLQEQLCDVEQTEMAVVGEKVAGQVSPPTSRAQIGIVIVAMHACNAYFVPLFCSVVFDSVVAARPKEMSQINLLIV